MNAETKHTPGPWTVIPAVPYDGDESEFEGAYTSPASIEGADGNPVCVFGSSEGSGSLFENEADYRLIAAAPEMAEALRAEEEADRLFDAADEYTHRAEGEGWLNDPTGSMHVTEAWDRARQARERAKELRRAALQGWRLIR